MPDKAERLINAFKDPQTGKSQSKTWEQLSSLPKATRSRLLREAIEKGYVTGSVKVKNGRLETIYELKKVKAESLSYAGAARIHKKLRW